jgi:ribosome biogenesis GTPase
VTLEDLSWDGRRDDQFAPFRAAGLEPGRVALEHTHIYRVVTPTEDVLARVAGRLRHEAATRRDFPAVGDWVALKTGSSGTTIHAVLPRTSQFIRKAAGRRAEEQVVAANVDTVFLVTGLDGDFNVRRIERYLILVWESGAQPIVVLNKADLADDLDRRIAETARVAAGTPVHVTSTRTGAGMDLLAERLAPGKTFALLGSSGVGKSSIVNWLAGDDLLKISEVRESDSRGRHTTSHRQLVVLPGGALVIDTPGMREIQLWDADEGISEVFQDIEALAPGCRFRDCQHRAEPGCAVRAAIDAGELEAGRLENYLKLQDERRSLEARVDERAQQEAKRLGKIQSKAIKRMQKDRER